MVKLRAQLDNEETDKQLDVPSILKSFLKGYITNTAVGMPDRSFRTFNTGQLISVHPSSTLFGKPNMDAIMYIEYVLLQKVMPVMSQLLSYRGYKKLLLMSLVVLKLILMIK